MESVVAVAFLADRGVASLGERPNFILAGAI